ncbi:MAG: YiiX/YebB-like N1pC/P60 family cysteine hydrolase [Phycisphaeraceae bacterium]|nr:YiiX/YebB-like N1pC/P60 family cysteine hydrolase [Phycisphaeraceae bacterium]
MTDSNEQIVVAVRTVAHLSEHFDRLKREALQMRDTFGADEHGYLTPTQEEQVLHLIISYWYSRNALFDLINQFFDGEEPVRDMDDRAFVLAYASAILLVDVARFLHEAFGDRAVAGKKLNHPIPEFGIPEGLYDTVQISLTSPMNAWHLHQANTVFDERAETWRRTAAGDDIMAPVWEVIGALGERVRVSASEYAQARLVARGQQVVRNLGKRPVLSAMYALQQWASEAIAGINVLPHHEPRLPRPVVEKLRALLKPGDVVINRKEFAVTNYFLPGYWPHAALYLGHVDALRAMGLHEHKHCKPRWSRLARVDQTDVGCVLESQKDGVQVRPINSVLHADAIAVIRPMLSPEQLPGALARGLSHEGKAYDFDFDFTRSDRMVCTEVVYRTYDGVGGMTFELKRRAGSLTLAAEDLLDMAIDRRWFETLAVYAPAHRSRLLEGADAIDALRNTVGSTDS